jgi:hypothetical protein
VAKDEKFPSPIYNVLVVECLNRQEHCYFPRSTFAYLYMSVVPSLSTHRGFLSCGVVFAHPEKINLSDHYGPQ